MNKKTKKTKKTVKATSVTTIPAHIPTHFFLPNPDSSQLGGDASEKAAV